MFRAFHASKLPRVALKNGLKNAPVRLAGSRMASGARVASEESKMVQLGGAGGAPSSIRELQALLPAIQQRGTPKKEIRIKQTKVYDETAEMEISWYDGTSSTFPYVWLRDNCQCEKCFDQFEKKRISMDSFGHGDATTPKNAKNLMEGTLLHLTWLDEHNSYFSAKWLQEHCFDTGMLPYIRQNYSPEPQLWNEKLCDSMKKHTLFYFDDLVDTTDDSKLLTWLATLQSVGFAKVAGAPTGGENDGMNALHDLISRCSPSASVKHHDRGPWNTFRPYDAGYQTSLPYYHHVPGIQLIHCDSPANESTLFVDGFAVAQSIRQKEPVVFDALASWEVAFQDESPGETENDRKFLRRRLAPIFELDKRGEVWRINYNNECRDSYMKKFSEGLEGVKDLYSCLQMLDRELNDAEAQASAFEYQLAPGDLVCVNNWRVAVRHGNGGQLTQAFFDWDEAESKVNVLSGQHRDLRFTPEM